MVSENKLGIVDPSELARQKEKISKKKALELFEKGMLDKDDYLPAMERSPVKTVEIKELLKHALTDEINDREVYMKGIDASYNYDGYFSYRIKDLD